MAEEMALMALKFSSGRIYIAYRHTAGLRPTGCQTSCHRRRGKEELAHGRTCKGNDMSANCRTAIIDLKFRCNITWFLQKKWIEGGGRGEALTLNCVITTTRRRVKLSRTKAGLKVSRLFKSHPPPLPSKRCKKDYEQNAVMSSERCCCCWWNGPE